MVSVAYTFAARSIGADQIAVNLRIVCAAVDPQPSIVVA